MDLSAVKALTFDVFGTAFWPPTCWETTTSPDPEVYQGAARLLGLPIDQVMMVASHKPDLKAAHEQGMQTAFVPKPLEYGSGVRIDVSPEPWLDLTATDFEDMAAKLGV